MFKVTQARNGAGRGVVEELIGEVKKEDRRI